MNPHQKRKLLGIQTFHIGAKTDDQYQRSSLDGRCLAGQTLVFIQGAHISRSFGLSLEFIVGWVADFNQGETLGRLNLV
jgi:hypothetical protein